MGGEEEEEEEERSVFSHAGIKVNPCFEPRRYFYARLPARRSRDEAAPRRSTDPRRRKEDSLAWRRGSMRVAYQRVSSIRPMRQMRGRRLRPSTAAESDFTRLGFIIIAACGDARPRAEERAPRPSGSLSDAAFPESARSNAHGPRDYVNSSDPGEQRAGLSGRSPSLRDISNNGATRETRGAKRRGRHNSSARASGSNNSDGIPRCN